MRYFSYNMMYYRISKNEKILFFGKKIAQVWAVTLKGKTEEQSTTPIKSNNWSLLKLYVTKLYTPFRSNFTKKL